MSVSKRALGSDLQKIDAHTITAAEYDEIPELDDAWFETARARRPDVTQEAISIRLDQDLVARLKASGSEWQSRVNAILREWAETNLPST